MRVDSLGGLKSAFGKWRSRKRHVREAVPEKLMERARRAAAVHGVSAVAQAAKVDYCRLAEGMSGATGSAGRSARRGGEAAGDGAKRASARRAGRTALAATRAKKETAPVPPYSRLEIPAREAAALPLAEVETPAGVKLRLFTITPETVALLSTLSASRRAL